MTTDETLTEKLATINPITVEVGTREYQITGIKPALWERGGRSRLYLNPVCSWTDSRYQFSAPYIDLATGQGYLGQPGVFVDSGSKRREVTAAMEQMVAIAKAAL